MNTLLLVGGELCIRTAQRLDPARWRCLGLRRRPEQAESAPITWLRGDLGEAESLAFLNDPRYAGISHILFAPAPGGRTPEHYEAVYAGGLGRLLASLPLACRERLQRCVLVGSSVVWGPHDGWVSEETPADGSNFRSKAILAAECTLHAVLPAPVGVALRLSGIYGPGRERLLSGLHAGTITAPEGPGHWANRIHIDDAAAACAHLLLLPDPEPVYIGTDDLPMPTAELYQALAKLVGAPAPVGKFIEPDGKRLSNARLKATGWQPQWPDAVQGYARIRHQPAAVHAISTKPR